jgi:flagellar hook protein FlgE
MSLTGALFSGVSGINANSNAMNIIGDNIANVNTVGFKSTRAVFFDLLSAQIGGAKVGTGSRLAAASRLFAQGGVQTTNSPTDMAVQGRGFFILKDSLGGKFYTRAGQFTVDKIGALVNAQGLKVQGAQLDSNGNPITGLTDIIINSKILAAPTATTSVSLAANLDAAATTPTAAFPAGPDAPPADWFAASNFSTVVTIFDSLGQAHDLTFLFRKTGPTSWDYRVVANRKELDTTAPTSTDLREVSTGTLNFTGDGTLTTSTINDIGPMDWVNGSTSQTIVAADVIFTGTTHYALPSAVSTLSQNGDQSGILTSISIDEKGVITGLFSSGRTRPLYRVALADFTNPEGLTHVGNTLFAQSPSSGEVLAGNPGTGGFGTVLSGFLELSTVDLAAEFIKMVTTQRGFQASSRTVTVADTLMEDVINLKR